MKLLVIALLISFVFGSPSPKPKNPILTHVDSNVSLVLDQALAQLSDALFSNDKRMTKRMKVEMESLKAKLMDRLTIDLASLSSEFLAERQEEQGELTPQEKMTFSDKLHERVSFNFNYILFLIYFYEFSGPLHFVMKSVTGDVKD